MDRGLRAIAGIFIVQLIFLSVFFCGVFSVAWGEEVPEGYPEGLYWEWFERVGFASDVYFAEGAFMRVWSVTPEFEKLPEVGSATWEAIDASSVIRTSSGFWVKNVTGWDTWPDATLGSHTHTSSQVSDWDVALSSYVVDATAGEISGNVWRHYFPMGYKLISGWPFVVVIGGAPYQVGGGLNVLPGKKPGMDGGLDVHFDDDSTETWPPGTRFNALMRLIAVDVIVTPTEEEGLKFGMYVPLLEEMSFGEVLREK